MCLQSAAGALGSSADLAGLTHVSECLLEDGCATQASSGTTGLPHSDSYIFHLLADSSDMFL